MRLGKLVVLAASFVVLASGTARAEGFISPLIGYDFSGDSGCPSINDCHDKKVNYGVAFGGMGTVLGVEEELAYAKDFFGDAPGLTSSVFTAMTNLMIAPKIGPVRPYVLGGLGLMKSKVDFTSSSLFSSSNNNLGWDLGGGVMIMFDHVGVRGDIRYLHSFQDLEALGFTLGNSKLDFARASAALVLAF